MIIKTSRDTRDPFELLNRQMAHVTIFRSRTITIIFVAIDGRAERYRRRRRNVRHVYVAAINARNAIVITYSVRHVVQLRGSADVT